MDCPLNELLNFFWTHQPSKIMIQSSFSKIPFCDLIWYFPKSLIIKISSFLLLGFIIHWSLLSTADSQELVIGQEELANNEQLFISSERLPKGWRVASDPELVKFGKRWWLFFNSIELNRKKSFPIHILSASLPAGKSLSAPASLWKVNPVPAISPGPKGTWDDHTTETPKFVHGYDNQREEWVGRIYYLGWSIIEKRVKDYRIGFAEWDGKSWVKHPDPVITGTHRWEKLHGYSFIGDQTAWYEPGDGPNGENGTWHMWYQTASKPKEGGVSLVHVTSKDGVVWSEKKRLTHKVPFANQLTKTGPFHMDVLVKNNKFYFAGFLYNQADITKQGLWLTTSTTPDGSAPGDFSKWYPLIYENNGISWHDSGRESSKCHKTGLFSATIKEDAGKTWLFYHGYFRKGKVKNVCQDNSKNDGAIGRALISELP